MYAIEERYYKINRILLKTLGLWPYQQSCFVRIQKVLLTCICFTFILVQLLVFVTTQYNASLLLKILSFVFPTLFVTAKYFLFVIRTDRVKQLLEQIRYDWSLLKDDLEFDIIKKYACNARSYIITGMVLYYFGIICFVIFQFGPIMLDIILPLNESRPCQLIVITEYFINQKKYIYVMLLHEVLAVSVGITAICGTGATLISYVLHVCALLEIASFHVENAIAKNTISSPKRREGLLYQQIVHAIVIHQRAIECTVLLASNFEVIFGILIIIGVGSLSFNFFQFLQLLIVTSDISNAFLIALLIIIHLIYMFVANYAGQEIIDHGKKLFRATYNGLWYAAPLHTQKLLLFIMQRGTMNINLTCGGILVASLEGFATLVNAAVSYFMMIYSTR